MSLLNFIFYGVYFSLLHMGKYGKETIINQTLGSKWSKHGSW